MLLLVGVIVGAGVLFQLLLFVSYKCWVLMSYQQSYHIMTIIQMITVAIAIAVVAIVVVIVVVAIGIVVGGVIVCFDTRLSLKFLYNPYRNTF
mmetsp:Transcript_27230/g.27731  ORF Transcript_27230/g.27731 Transcript_27230/m.27731 type:complete len:93 (+) Transcript_27230:146-424(+)